MAVMSSSAVAGRATPSVMGRNGKQNARRDRDAPSPLDAMEEVRRDLDWPGR